MFATINTGVTKSTCNFDVLLNKSLLLVYGMVSTSKEYDSGERHSLQGSRSFFKFTLVVPLHNEYFSLTEIETLPEELSLSSLVSVYKKENFLRQQGN